MPDEVEFLGSGDADRPRGVAEELPGGGRPRIPHWMLVVAGALIVVVIAGVVLSETSGSPQHHRSGSTATAKSNVNIPEGNASDAGPVYASSPSEQAIFVGSGLIQLGPGGLERVDLSGVGGPRVAARVPVRELAPARPDVSFDLAVDAPAHLVWVTAFQGSASASTGSAVAFDALTLRKRGSSLSWPGGGQASAAVGGKLYVASGGGVWQMTPTEPAARIAGLTGEYFGVVADPSRSRLLLIGGGHTPEMTVRSYVPSTGAVSAPVPVGFGKGGLLLAAGRIWAGGFGYTGHRAVLEKLDPRTLQPVAHSPLAAKLGPGAVLITAGTRVIWVQSGDSDKLWCVDAATGQTITEWTRPETLIASRTGQAWVEANGTARALALHDCPG